MANKIIGVDFGAHSVKVAIASAGLRAAQIVDYVERAVPAGEGAYDERAALILQQLVRERGLDHDVPYVALAGDAISMRVMDFRFVGIKRADLDKAVGNELEQELPHELEEMVYAFDATPRYDDVAPQDPKKKRAPSGTRVLAAATTRDKVSRLLALAAAHGYEPPHGVVAAPTAYARLASRLAALGGPEAAGDGLMIIDHGHARTNVCVVKSGRVVFGRTLSRGGKHVTQAILRAWPHLTWEQAEQAKHADGFVASQREPAQSDQWQAISDVLKHELLTLVRDLRQTLAACRAQAHVNVDRAVLAGGGGRLRGLASFLSEEVGVPVGVVTAGDQARVCGPQLAGRQIPVDSALLAVGVALEGAGGRPTFDLRQGPLAYRTDFSFLRKRAGYLAICALLLVGFAAGNAYASLYKLRTEQRILDARLESETKDVFGQPLSVEELEGKITPKKEESPLPKMTSFDVLVDMSKHLPAKTEGKLDVMELEIAPKKINLRAVADSSATIDAVVKKLKEIDCFTDIQKGREDTQADGKQFTLTIQHKCM